MKRVSVPRDFEAPKEPEDTIITIDAETNEVLRVGYNHCLASSEAQRALSRAGIAKVLQEIDSRPSIVLTGPIADLLYVALAGHAYNKSPHEASTHAARSARAIILSLRSYRRSWELAHQAIQVYGDYIQPFLGVSVLDEDGRPDIVGERIKLTK